MATEVKVSVEDMDARIVEAFYRALHESVKDSDLPMEPSDFQKDHLMLYQDINYKLDLRQSSFKRVNISDIICLDRKTVRINAYQRYN